MVIAKAPRAGRRGTDTAGLLRYLFGRGRANEHTDPHVVASSLPEWVRGGEFAERLGRRGGIAQLARLLEAHRLNHQIAVPGGHVYHCPISLSAADGELGEQRWAELAEDAVSAMGFGPDEHGRGGCEWVAVHHGRSAAGNDHLHLVINLVNSSGEIAETYQDWPRWRAWCQRVEHTYGLTPTSPARTGRAGSSRGLRERTRRVARVNVEAERGRLRRLVQAAAVDAASELEFIAGLSARQVAVRARTDAAGRVIGYAVARPDSHRWISASTLRRDLSLPRLRARWQIAVSPAAAAAGWAHPERLPAVPRAAGEHTWPGLLEQLDQAHAQLQQALARPRGSYGGGAGPAHQLAGQLAEVLTVLLPSEARRDGPLHRAHEHLTRAAQPPPRLRHQGTRMLAPALTAAGDLLAHAPTPEAAVLATAVLTVTALVALLAEFVAGHRLHEAARGHIATAGQLLGEHPLVAEQQHPRRGRARTAAAQAATSALTPPARSPQPPRATGTGSPAAPRRRPTSPPRPQRQQNQPPQRGR